MVATVSINPQVQSNFAGTFFKSSTGYTQGDTLADPAIRYSLRKGIVDLAAASPLYGGLAITEKLAPGLTGGAFPFTGESHELQSILTEAANVTAGDAAGYTGFTTYQQATAMIQSAQGRVPVAAVGMAINFYRSKSGARLVVKALAAAVAAWAAGVDDPTTIYWDTVLRQVTNASGGNSIGPLPNVTLDALDTFANSRVVSLSGGFYNWLETGSTAVIVI